MSSFMQRPYLPAPPGLPDELFARGDVPMTKSEVRALTMTTARLRPGHRVLDVGAGTGSLTIEAALLCPEGEAVARGAQRRGTGAHR